MTAADTRLSLAAEHVHFISTAWASAGLAQLRRQCEPFAPPPTNLQGTVKHWRVTADGQPDAEHLLPTGASPEQVAARREEILQVAGAAAVDPDRPAPGGAGRVILFCTLRLQHIS